MVDCNFCTSVALGVFPGLMLSLLIASAYFEIASARTWNEALMSDGALAASPLKYVFRLSAFKLVEVPAASACPSLDAELAKSRQRAETLPELPLPLLLPLPLPLPLP